MNYQFIDVVKTFDRLVPNLFGNHFTSVLLKTVDKIGTANIGQVKGSNNVNANVLNNTDNQKPKQKLQPHGSHRHVLACKKSNTPHLRKTIIMKEQSPAMTMANNRILEYMIKVLKIRLQQVRTRPLLFLPHHT